jgi:hypothetical protein
VTELEEKVLMLKMRLKKFKTDFQQILENRTDGDKAVLVFDNKDPHLKVKTNK